MLLFTPYGRDASDATRLWTEIPWRENLTAQIPEAIVEAPGEEAATTYWRICELCGVQRPVRRCCTQPALDRKGEPRPTDSVTQPLRLKHAHDDAPNGRLSCGRQPGKSPRPPALRPPGRKGNGPVLLGRQAHGTAEKSPRSCLPRQTHWQRARDTGLWHLTRKALCRRATGHGPFSTAAVNAVAHSAPRCPSPRPSGGLGRASSLVPGNYWVGT